MITDYVVILPEPVPHVSARLFKSVDLPAEPSYEQLKALMVPIFGDAPLEHVAVLQAGERTDMFIDRDGHTKRLLRNEMATAVYRADWMTQHPDTDPETLPYVVGPAVVFSRRVWF